MATAYLYVLFDFVRILNPDTHNDKYTTAHKSMKYVTLIRLISGIASGRAVHTPINNLKANFSVPISSMVVKRHV